MILMYDQEDNLVTIFDTYKDCANYFNTSINVIRSHICRVRKGLVNKKLMKGKGWFKLYYERRTTKAS